MEVLFEDNYLLAVNKPAGIIVEKDSFRSPSLQAQAEDYILANYPGKKQLKIGVVHRIDRWVSGIVLFTKTPLLLKQMNLLFENRLVTKKYLAILENGLPEKTGELRNFLVKDVQHKCSRVVAKNHARGLEALLAYSVLEEKNNYCLVKIELFTGRFHQIRIQMSHAGCPVLNDVKYGAKKITAYENIFLHSHSLSFLHPKTNDKIEIESPMPEGWKKIIG